MATLYSFRNSHLSTAHDTTMGADMTMSMAMPIPGSPGSTSISRKRKGDFPDGQGNEKLAKRFSRMQLNRVSSSELLPPHPSPAVNSPPSKPSEPRAGRSPFQSQTPSESQIAIPHPSPIQLHQRSTIHQSSTHQPSVATYDYDEIDNDVMQLDDTKHKVYIYNLDDELSDTDSSETQGIYPRHTRRTHDSDTATTERISFLSDIDKRLRRRIPDSVLRDRPSGDVMPLSHADKQLILYQVPSSLSVPENEDSVRMAVLEARERARRKLGGGSEHINSSAPHSDSLSNAQHYPVIIPTSNIRFSTNGNNEPDETETERWENDVTLREMFHGETHGGNGNGNGYRTDEEEEYDPDAMDLG